MGGELGPDEMVAGAIQAVEESDLNVVLIGDENILNNRSSPCPSPGCMSFMLHKQFPWMSRLLKL
jgi:fatty acid/phospholipid biosynthesis enzyme